MMIKDTITLLMRKFFKKQVSIAVLSVKWLDLKRCEGKVKAVTLQNYNRQINLHINPILGFYDVSSVSEEVIQMFIEILMKDKGLNPTTVRNIVGRLSEIMNFAVKEGLIYNNPCTLVLLPKGKNKKGKALTLEEKISLEKVLSTQKIPQNIAIQLALYAGLRISEITALRWKDIDFKQGFIHVQHSFKRIQTNNKEQKTILHLGTPKSQNSVRAVPMNRQIKACLEDYYKVLNDIQAQDESFVVGKKNGSFYDVRAIQRHFVKLCKIAGIEHCHFHDLRHTFATNAKESGIDIQLISEILGHAHTATTMNIYLHPSYTYKKEEIKKMDQIPENEYLKVKSIIEKICSEAV